ncbi:MAG: asparagine synthase (glutamine-hydrolyzing), partial [Candidatus Hydrogenedentes bacterium]|nr:asparagine synthase (glutamine-hydrolyzing) [Candidatus Hydrogenedentota bacterium]
MCGIAGFLAPTSLGEDARATLEQMTKRIVHRGPDDAGHWLDQDAGVALGHRRLAIIDLSLAGHQPMTSHSGRYVIVYNGEIYNYREIRIDLEAIGTGTNWRGHSDTEVLLAAIDHWGVEETLVRLNGMFAFALWDRKERHLYLARDRLGEKPLYYGQSGNIFLFGSELKALTAHPIFRGEVDREALALYLFMRHKYIPSPWSIWKGIRKLLPAHYLVVRDGGRQVGELKCYWNFATVAEKGAGDPLPDDPDLEDRLDKVLREAVASRMKADVPLGVLLSGGIDSSTVAALMQAQSSRPVKTFSIGFDEESHNEAFHARAVAAHLGTDHTELYVSPEHALAVVTDLPTYWDEPFADSSQIPTYLVCEMARQHVTVSLTGDGGDELFGGYKRYVLAMRLWRYLNLFPERARRLLAELGRSPAFAAVMDAMTRLLPPSRRHLALGTHLPKVSQLLMATSQEDLYRKLLSHWKYPSNVVLAAVEPEILLTELALFDRSLPFPDFRQKMMYVDTLTYLPDDILVKVDRASMAVSLEARVPFLDHRVVEFAWRVPVNRKFRRGKGKQILRDILHRYVPRSLVDRPKLGFRVPIESWLRGPFKDCAEDLLDERRL